MAERRTGRGGRRDPGTRQPPSGPGPYSSRTDGQSVQPPDLDRPDVQSGDVGEMEAAQRAVPVPRQREPVGGGGSPAAAAPPLDVLRGGALAPWMTDRASLSPEPVTAGMNGGAGPGPEVLANPPVATDDFEMLMEYFVRNYSDQGAADTLRGMRGGRQGQPGPTMPAPFEHTPAPEEEIGGEVPLGDEEDEFGEMDFDEDFVEGELEGEPLEGEGEPIEGEFDEETEAEAVAEEVPAEEAVEEPAVAE